MFNWMGVYVICCTIFLKGGKCPTVTQGLGLEANFHCKHQFTVWICLHFSNGIFLDWLNKTHFRLNTRVGGEWVQARWPCLWDLTKHKPAALWQYMGAMTDMHPASSPTAVQWHRGCCHLASWFILWELPFRSATRTPKRTCENWESDIFWS